MKKRSATRLHHMITVGSSFGCFTALRAASVLYTDHEIPVRAALLLDAGLEWEMPDWSLLSDEECAAVAEEGTLLCLFEQPGVGMEVPAIARMVNLGDRVLVIGCRDKSHNRISVNAYRYGLFSWGLEEYAELDPEEYTPVLLQPEASSSD